MSKAGCLPLAESRVCTGSQFSGYYVPPSDQFPNITQFDDYMLGWADDSPVFATVMQSQFGCPQYGKGTNTTSPAAATSPFRLHLTAYCGAWAYLGSGPCGTPNNGTLTPVCLDTFKNFVDSWTTTMVNPNVCLPDEQLNADQRKTRANYIALFQEPAKGGVNSLGCAVAIAADSVTFCGFPTIDEGQRWCNKNYDVCCAYTSGLKQVLPAPTQASAAAPAAPPAPNTSSGVPIIPIAIGGGAVLFIIVVILIGCIWKSNRQRRSDATQLADTPDNGPAQYGRQNTHSSGKHSDFNEGRKPSTSYDQQKGGPYSNQYGGSQQQQQQAFASTKGSQVSYGGQQQQQYGNQFNNNPAQGNTYNSYGQQQPVQRMSSQYKSIVQPQPAANPWNSPPMPVMPPGYSQPANTKTFWAILNFKAENPDEMSLRIGDVVTVNQTFDDGWCFGRLVSTGAEGIFPFECVAEAPNMKSQTPGKNKFNNRVSSIYGGSFDQQQIQQQQQQPSDGSYKIMYDYYPNLADELMLRAGERVVVVEEYDDGWAFGANIKTRAEGLFPLDILENFRSKKMVSNGARNLRDSSRYSAHSMLRKPSQTQQSKAAPVSQPQQQQQGSIVAYDFQPVQPDEVRLRIGDRVVVSKEYDDGWAFGRNLSTGQEGLFPLDTLQTGVLGENKPRKGRASSFFGSTENSNIVSAQSNSSERVVYEFTPERPDEITLRIGDEVVINQEFDDGWGFGVNITTNKEGNFPLDCLASFSDPNPTVGVKKPKQRVSSIFEVDAAKTNAPKVKGQDKAIYDYMPERSDEITLRVGDIIAVEQSFDDGWAYGKNLTNGQTGNFPLDCLASSSEAADSAPSKGHNQRQSSIFEGNNVDSKYSAVDNSKNNLNSVYTVAGNTDSYYAPQNTDSIYTTAGNNTDSYYAPTPATPKQQQQQQQQPQSKNDKVLYAFAPERSDEVELRVGDSVQVQQAYDDGWAYGKNLSSGKEGNFPQDCLASAAETMDQPISSVNPKQRVSSIYGSEYGQQDEPEQAMAKVGADQAAVAFTPAKSDEVALAVGDNVMIKKAYDDGWCYGVNVKTKREGYFPYDCLVSYAQRYKTGSGGKKQRVSSIYDADFAYQNAPVTAAPQAPAPAKAATINVVYSFQPEKDDELMLRLGDKIQVLHSFDDGWSYGKNLSTGKEGNFPSDCLENSNPENVGKSPKQRASSMLGAATPMALQVIYDFMPEQSDEVLLYAGDQVEVLKSYDDGWCYVRNLSSGQEGLCPEDCIDGYNDGGVKIGNRHKQRVSSMYGA
ncbi:hypothetical protein BJ741DRAFT_19954 [Chytriomyces cf. hyalinus JEL632]|nr:hypothetical protein BJ741DRAFT_19954 [Chytriomyces cf. hyalinus JEL632]